MGLGPLAPSASALLAAVLLDALLGDPQLRWHPIRLAGGLVERVEKGLRNAGADGYGGGIALGLTVAGLFTGAACTVAWLAAMLHPWIGWAVHVLIVYSLLALRDLLDHAWRVESEARAGNASRARQATAMFVSRDTAPMDIPACRRAAIESVAENFTDGFASPVFWYVVAGLPGMLAFKAFSTLDSMVGNKSERYLRFGWFSARTDDVLNWLPARLSWPLLAAAAALLPRCSARCALAVGWRQHAVVPGPNSGWSEAAVAGALRRRLVGPIFSGGMRVTELWLGRGSDPPAGESPADIPRALRLTALAAAMSIGLAIVVLPARG